MLLHNVELGWLSLRSHRGLTFLMIAIIAVGIAAFATTLAIFLAMNTDPIPGKSQALFAVQLEYWPGSAASRRNSQITDDFQDQVTFDEATAVVAARQAVHQTAMYATSVAVATESGARAPEQVDARATSADFFSMFQVPFRYGSGWGADNDTAHANVVVLSSALNEHLFGGKNSVGQTIRLNGKSYVVLGVIRPWEPVPRFYDLISDKRFGRSEDVFLPFSRAVDEHMASTGDVACNGEVKPGWEGQLHSDCAWIQLWVELHGGDAIARYGAFLSDLQRHITASPRERLFDVQQWLAHKHVVSNDIHLLLIVSFSFLCVCLLNAMGLMLARIARNTHEISIRRALGASRLAVLTQNLTESGLIGLIGGFAGIVLTAAGLWATSILLSDDFQRLTDLSYSALGSAMLTSILGCMVAGLYPACRVAYIEPSLQMKEL